MSAGADPALAAQAAASGVAVSYVDWRKRRVDIPADTIGAVLAALGETSAAGAGATAVPAAAPAGARRLELPDRTWGWMLQLYSLRSAGSWGIGDYRDLADIAAWSASTAGGGAGFVLCNPLHAITPVHPIENSPYFPSSRRFRSALYLRIEDIPEYAGCDEATRTRVAGLRPSTSEGLIDRDAVWSAKLAALEELWPHARQAVLADFRRLHGGALDDFALFCTLAEEHGPDWRQWADSLHDPGGSAALRVLAERPERVRFHAWLQLLCDEQLRAAADAAREAGMPIGVVHDLAVGVDPAGADAWALQDVLATGATVGCPPDSFNQRGQDWQLPPWHPGRLAAAGYAPFREMIRSVLRHAGGIRVDHVMGLFRLWWIPVGNPPDQGAYVSYDWRAMLDVLLDEAEQVGAVLIAEDLGTVEVRVTEALAAAGILGSNVAWFEHTAAGPVPPEQWRPAAMASVTTHDLPTVAGWLSDEPIRVRAGLGRLTGPVERELGQAATERAQLLALLEQRGFLRGHRDDPHEVALALYRLLAATPCRLLAASPADAVGDLRQPNLPGTVEDYPNWRLPLASRDGHAVTVEKLCGDPAVRRLIEVLAGSATVAGVIDPPGRPR